jgi:hypothetical protein
MSFVFGEGQLDRAGSVVRFMIQTWPSRPDQHLARRGCFALAALMGGSVRTGERHRNAGGCEDSGITSMGA